MGLHPTVRAPARSARANQFAWEFFIGDSLVELTYRYPSPVAASRRFG